MTPRLLCIALLVAGLVAPAAALSPEEVLVVANINVDESVDLAAYYAEKRGIPEENVLLIRTAAGYGVSRESYDKHILTPIREFLIQRTSPTPIRCICLMWGVPVRIENVAKMPPKETLDFYSAQATRAQQVLAMDREYLARIGRDFTPPAVTVPIGK